MLSEKLGLIRESAEDGTLWRVRGIVAAVTSSFFLSISFALASLLEVDMDPLEVYAFRQTFLAIYTLPLVSIRKQAYYFAWNDHKRWGQLAVRTFLGSLNIYCMFKAVQYIPLSDASVISATAPIFCNVLAACILREKIGLVEVLLSGGIFVGILLNSKPTWLLNPSELTSGGSTDRLIGTAFAFGSALSGALSTIAMRTMKDIDWATIQLIYAYQSLVITWPLVFIIQGSSLPSCDSSRWFSALVGAAAVPMQAFYIYACQVEKAGVVSIARASTPMFAFIWQVTVFAMMPDFFSISGGLIILACIIIMGVIKIRKASVVHEDPDEDGKEYGRLAESRSGSQYGLVGEAGSVQSYNTAGAAAPAEGHFDNSRSNYGS